MRNLVFATALALGSVSLAAPAAAQIQAPAGLVNVTVGNVILEDILTDIEITALNDLDVLNNNQIVVQVPVSVAANVCNIPVAVLAKQKSTGEGCTAQSGSDALARVIRQRIKNAR